MPIRYTSRLTTEHLEELRKLLFFDSSAQRYRSPIEAFGEPVIKSDNGRLRVHTTRLGEVQALFALEDGAHDGRPVGVAIYVRNAEDAMAVLQIAVDRAYANGGPNAGDFVASNLIRRLVESCRQIKGIRHLRLLYDPAQNAEIPIPHLEETHASG